MMMVGEELSDEASEGLIKRRHDRKSYLILVIGLE
jgi:hypothetical protein